MAAGGSFEFYQAASDFVKELGETPNTQIVIYKRTKEFAENYFSGESLTFHWNQIEVDNARYRIARILLAGGDRFTQIVWKETKNIGVGRSDEYAVIFYWPIGNIKQIS